MAFSIYEKSLCSSQIRQLDIGSTLLKNNKSIKTDLIYQIASILGLEFEKNVLKSLYFKATGKHLECKLNILFLVRDEIIIFKDNETFEKSLSGIEHNIFTSLHLLAAETYEYLYRNNLKEHLERILNHYKLSNHIVKYKEYLWLQAKYSVLQYKYENAKIIYFQLLELEEKVNEKFNLIIKIGNVFRNASEWSEEIILYEKYLRTFSGNNRDELVIKLCELYVLKGKYDKYKRLLSKLSKNEKQNITIRLQIIKANFELNKGNYDVSLKIIDDLLSKTTGDLYGEALSLKGIVKAKQHCYEDSIEIHKSLYKDSEDSNNKQLMVKSLINVAEGYFFKGDYPIASEYYEIALRVSKKINRKNAIAICHGNLGTINYVKNEYHRAISYFVKQLRIFNSIGNRNGIANAYGMLGACMISLGNFKKALYYLKNQYEIVGQLKTKKSLAICLGNIGVVYNLIGEFDIAIKHFKKQLLIDYDIKNYEGIFRALGNIGNQYYLKGKYHLSQKFLLNAIKIANKHNIKLNVESVFYLYSSVLFKLKEFQQSEAYAIKASELSAKVNNTIIKISSDIAKEKATLYSDIVEKSYVKKNCEKILSMKNLTNNDEAIALIYYELYGIEKDFNLPNTLHRKLAVKYYSNLHKSIPKFEFRQKLIQLSS